ncbi:MAG TPA: c-type cytochrome [Vicinamibacterales bacterium]|jgi:cytochrome c oxidase cbb3-type subunit 3
MSTGWRTVRAFTVIGTGWIVAMCAVIQLASAQGRGQASPAAQPPPPTATPQQYSREQIEAGRTRFASQCGFCHGRDAAGGESGPDLTRSALVAGDVRGDRIGPVIRSGRVDKGMPAFTLSDTDLAAIVAFVHDQKTLADAATGGRRAVDVADLQTGDAVAGKRYFDGACGRCHSASGDLAGIAGRLQGLPLLQRMLNPSSGRGVGPRGVPTITVTTKTGQVVTGKQAYRDEFTIALTDTSGWYHSWPTSQVKLTVDDPLQAHVDQLAKYTDADVHNVLAYLQTLK